MSEKGKADSFASALAKYALKFYIGPELKRSRKQSGSSSVSQFWAAEVVFFEDDSPPAVRIDTEVVRKGQALRKERVATAQALGKPDDDKASGHVIIFDGKEGWTVECWSQFDRGLSIKHLRVAEQFYRAAGLCRVSQLWAPFIDSLFSAAELCVTAFLLSIPGGKFPRKRTHPAITERLRWLADAGNVEAEHREAFNRLSGLRNCARYLKGDLVLAEADAAQLFETVGKMLQDCRRRLRLDDNN